MAYDEKLADRLRSVLDAEGGLTEKRMFGGCAFLVNGNMAVAASGRGGLLLRVDPAEGPSLLEQAGVSRFRMGGREMNGWLHIEDATVRTDGGLRRWVKHGTDYAKTLPPK